ncbi:MAG: DMT family transporter [Alphaproteobacteria bacterium]|nr:DMT family transporter [Alphaproteobacteria bacterium]
MATSSPAPGSPALGVLYAVTAAVFFSTAGFIVRRLDLPAWDVSLARSVFLGVTLLPLLWWTRHQVIADARHAGFALVLSGALLAGSFVAFILALGLAPVANVLIVFGAIPFITALGARLFLGEPLHRHTLACMALACAGLALSVGGSLQAGALAGMALAFVVSLCMGANYVVVRARRDVGMVPGIALACLFSGLVALPFASFQTPRWEEIPWLLALSPGQLGIGLLLYVAALKHIPAGRAALLGLLELVLGPIWVWLLDGETPGPLTLAGGGLVITAAALNVWLDSRDAPG